MIMSNLRASILRTLPGGWQSHRLYIGQHWTLSAVQNAAGEQRAGVAATPSAEAVAAQFKFRYGPNRVRVADALELAAYLKGPDPVATAIGLATVNALLQPDPALLQDLDAADWLVENGRGRKVALVGGFPFKEELKPVVGQLWVLELHPEEGEYLSEEAPNIIPQADILAITGSTLVNHTLEGLLALARPETTVMLLGPTTPLTPVMFDFGVDLLSGVQVLDIAATLDTIIKGLSFRKMAGMRRVTLRRPPACVPKGEETRSAAKIED